MAKETVLVADADPRNLRLVEMALRRAGFVVVTCATGEQGLHHLNDAGVQALICDLALPAPDGLALCRAARAKQAIPVVVMGADASAAAKTREPTSTWSSRSCSRSWCSECNICSTVAASPIPARPRG